MKKIAFVFIIIFLFAFTPGNKWVEINIDSKLTVEFPEKVEMKNVDGKQIYSYKSEECLFAVVAKNISSKHDLNNQQELTQVYEGVIQGTLNAAKEPQLIYKKDFKNSGVQ
ncbi:hypothetical protein C3K47_18245 [Solitalea longa]|uniref:Uncharacterized protein n=1 Tax=Solitalea longa TaxID=2079460 RepID=A0A2S4ZY83_9SPHI|nr:hypothetical protein [Solitalea longa]POY34892.1 hypothetical protein C3K47_18245 [Solitalea longa]